MASTVLTGDRRWGSTRKSGMTVLGKVPKPINLPSQRLENHGLDPNVEIVPKGTLTWGSRPSPVANAWGSSALLSPNTDGSSGSPSHVSGRPSSGSGTRPSTAGSDRSHELGSNALCSNSRPSSASGPLTSNHTSAVVTRPRSAETRPNSAQLSRFAEPQAESTVAWGPARSSERVGVAPFVSNEFTLSSGDFPSLGTDKSSDTQMQRGHSSHGRPGSSGAAATQKEASTPLSAGDSNADAYSDRGNVMSWKADGYPYVCSAPPNVNWQTEPQQVQVAQPYPSGNLPSHQFGPWHNAPVHSPGGVWYRGGAVEGPFRPAGTPGSYPVEPYVHYPQFPVKQPNSEPHPRPATGEGGHHSKNMVSYHHHRPPDSHMVPNHQVIPPRPGFYPSPVSYEGYYRPPHGTFCISSEHEVHIMKSASGQEPTPHSVADSEGHSANPVSTINSSREISLLRKPDTANYPNQELQKHPAIKHDATLMAKIESLNSKARSADDSIGSKEKKKHARVANRADHSRKEISTNPLPSEYAPSCGKFTSNSDNVDASIGNMNKKSPSDELGFAGPSEPLAFGGGKSDSFEADEKGQSKAHKRAHIVRGRVGENDDAQHLTNVSDAGSGPAESSSETITNQIPDVPSNQGPPQATEKVLGRTDNHWKSQSSRKSIRNQGPPQATEKLLGRTDNHWKSQSSKKSIRNQQASRPVDKLHGSEAVVWAPVKPSSPETSQTTSKISDQTSGKNEHDMQNVVKTKRAEMERYVPKPAAKELSQQDNSQGYYRLLDHEEHDSLTRKPEPMLETSEQDQLSKLSSLPEKEFQHDEGSTSTAKLVPTEKISQPVVIRDQRLPGRRRQEYVVHNIAASGGAPTDKDLQKSTVDKNDTESPKVDSDQSDRRVASRTKNHNPVGERMKSQWQPKYQAQSRNLLHGNVGEEGQGITSEEVRPIGELQSQGVLGYFSKNRNNAPGTRASGTGRHTLNQEASKGQSEEQTCTANQDLLTDAELACGSTSTKHEHQPVNSAARRPRHLSSRFNRAQEAGYKVVGQDAGKQSPQLDGDRRKGFPHHEVSKGQLEEQTCTANQDPLTNAELAYGTISTKHELQPVNPAPRRQRHQNSRFNRGQEAGYKVVGQDAGEHSPHFDGGRQKGIPHQEYQRIEPYNRVGDSLRQNFVSSEEAQEGPRVPGSNYRVRGHNHPRRGGQFYAQRRAAVQDGDLQ